MDVMQESLSINETYEEKEEQQLSNVTLEGNLLL